MKTVVERIRLAKMPFDKWDECEHKHIHATGYEVRFEGETKYYLEYEDDVDFNIDSPNCIYRDESTKTYDEE